MEENRKYRMYGLVPYNISPIQQGIQFGHAVVEYGLEYNKDTSYLKWAKEDKVFIILNGGTTNTKWLEGEGRCVGSLNNHLSSLLEKDIKASVFYEEDLGNQLTAVVFLVGEEVFDKEKYPDYPDWYIKKYGNHSLIATYTTEDYIDTDPDAYRMWVTLVGGDKNVWLRDFLKQFRLA